MIITGAHFSTGGAEVVLYSENAEKYVVSLADAKKTGLYKYAEDDSLLPFEADNEMLEFLSQKMKCIKYAVYLLEFGDKSRKTLFQKLKTKGYERDVCEAALAVLEKNGLVNDEKLCLDKLVSMARGKLYGPYRLKGELIKKGFSREQAEAAFDEAELDFDELLDELVEKLTKRGVPENEKELAAFKNKLIRYGYSYDSVSDKLSALMVD